MGRRAETQARMPAAPQVRWIAPTQIKLVLRPPIFRERTHNLQRSKSTPSGGSSAAPAGSRPRGTRAPAIPALATHASKPKHTVHSGSAFIYRPPVGRHPSRERRTSDSSLSSSAMVSGAEQHISLSADKVAAGAISTGWLMTLPLSLPGDTGRPLKFSPAH